jgi:hypothetical protein
MTYNVGDVVFYASNDNRAEKIPCPVCFGKLEVIVILGNGDEISTPCSFCEKGWEGPKGHITEYMQIPRVERVVITRRTIEEHSNNQKIEYYADRMHLEESRTFNTKEAAAIFAKELSDTYNADVMDKYVKEKSTKSYAWNAGYHLRAAAEKRRDAEYHEKKARVCQERSRNKNE